MKIRKTKSGTTLWLSKKDTYKWTHKANASWPCSFLSGKSLRAEFDNTGDLVDVRTNGKYGCNCPADEFNAITSDFLKLGASVNANRLF